MPLRMIPYVCTALSALVFISGPALSDNHEELTMEQMLAGLAESVTTDVVEVMADDMIKDADMEKGDHDAMMPKGKTDLQRVIASVNGVDITLGHVAAASLQFTAEELQGPPEQLLKDLVEMVVRTQAFARFQSQPNALSALRIENLRREMLAIQAMSAITADITITEQMIADAYQERFIAPAAPPEYNTSHILVTSEDDAKLVVTELEEGIDFKTVAMERSIGPSAASGGELGWLTAERMVPSYAEAVMALNAGEISSPVQTQFGWHVIRLNDSKVEGVPVYEDVRANLRATLFAEMQNRQLNNVLETAQISRMDLTGINPMDVLLPLMENSR